MSDADSKALPTPADDLTKTPGFGKSEEAAEQVRQACALAAQVGKTLAERFGGPLGDRERRKLVQAFKSAFMLKRRRGRKPKQTVTEAYQDWKAGMRGVALYRKHIRNWEKLSRWRRQAEERGLLQALYSRRRRAQEN